MLHWASSTPLAGFRDLVHLSHFYGHIIHIFHFVRDRQLVQCLSKLLHVLCSRKPVIVDIH